MSRHFLGRLTKINVTGRLTKSITISHTNKRSFSYRSPNYDSDKTELFKQIENIKLQLQDQADYIQIIKEELDDANDKINYLYTMLTLIENTKK